MTTKEWLNRARCIDDEIASLKLAREKAFSDCISVTRNPSPDVIQTSTTSHDGKLVALGDLSRMIDDRLEELCRVKSEILTVISSVEDGKLRSILTERYINCKTWEQVAVDTHYSYSQLVKYKHPQALAAAKDAIECHI